MSFINVKSNTPFSGFFVIFKGSVANENEKNYGISHVMEHLLCKNFECFYSDFTRDGVDWNAYTGDNEIVFYITGLEKYIAPYRKEYLKKLLSFNITKEQFDNEIKIILQEYNNYFTDQRSAHHLNLSRKKFNYFGPLGSGKVLKNLTLDDCKEYFELQYSKPHMVINISEGGLFEENIDFQIGYNSVKYSYEEEDPNVELEFLSQFKETSSVMNYKIVSDNFKEHKIISAVLGEGLESPLYKRIREEKGLVYYIDSTFHVSSDDIGSINISSEMEDGNVSEFQETVKEVLSEDLDPERFEIIRQSRRVMLEKDEVMNYMSVRKYISPKRCLDLDFINNMDYNKINDLFKKEYSTLTESVDKKELPPLQ